MTTLPPGVGGPEFQVPVSAHGVPDAESRPAVPLPLQKVCFGRNADLHVRHKACGHVVPVVGVGHGAGGGGGVGRFAVSEDDVGMVRSPLAMCASRWSIH